MPRGEASYYDMLGTDAFGNFRTLLQDVTLSPMMGQFLSMLGNDKGNATTDPDENYAREVMQLFTIGLCQLNDDGSQKLDATGATHPHLFEYRCDGTGRGFHRLQLEHTWRRHRYRLVELLHLCRAGTTAKNFCPCRVSRAIIPPCRSSFLASPFPLPAAPDPDGDLKIALDTLFNHPNLPAFFSKQMIQHMVTSNPSPTYINRVPPCSRTTAQACGAICRR